MTAPSLPGLDLEALATHLDQARPALRTGPLDATHIAGGRSNLTYSVTDGTSRWVVRRPPLGHVLATAHDMSREHRILSALHQSAVPVPRPILLCDEPSVLGAPFYVMEHVSGIPYRHADELRALGSERTRTIATRLVDALVALHSIDYHAVGLADFGRPDNFLARQINRWKKQLDQSHSRDVEGFDELHTRLMSSVPQQTDTTIVHGDFRLDNVLVDDQNDNITAVLDWEMATLGDPLTDIALLAVYNELPTDSSIVSDTTQAPGFLSPEELLQRYAIGSGRDMDALDFYLALAHFKLAVILEGIHRRYLLGKTVGTGFDSVGELVPSLVNGGLERLAA